jgi:transposase-like protein
MARSKKESNRTDELLDELLLEYRTPEDILGESGLLKQLSQRLIERKLAGELTRHLKTDVLPRDEPIENERCGSNSRNGYSKKTVQSQYGVIELSIPRDHKGEFEPVLVPKHQRRLAGLDEKILALYARGLSIRNISAQLEELYGAQISASLISEVTEEVKAWQCRPLERVKPL